ncbi:MAG TPA: hypothetical protein VKE69_09305, partial [Planctomycetota bacterium]|nr:hypothetical protein [Planctomycetota bacterium]
MIVDGRVLGTAPLELHFTHYGPRLVRAELLEASGGKTLVAQQQVELDPPWYGSFPFDIVSELLLPIWRTDYHRVVLILEPGGASHASRAASLEDPEARDDAAIRRARALQRWTPGEP